MTLVSVKTIISTGMISFITRIPTAKLKIPVIVFLKSESRNAIPGIFNFTVGILLRNGYYVIFCAWDVSVNVINEIIPVDIIVFTDTRVIE